jgi:hypothetical protein
MNQLKVVTYIDSNLSGALFVGALARLACVTQDHRAEPASVVHVETGTSTRCAVTTVR